MRDIKWNNLKTYSGDNKKSFEQLCYQIVVKEFEKHIKEGAILTPVDDSGGGDGVEFYLTFKNGDVFGWQAKFFGRLDESGRKEQIKQSLQTSYEKHPNLKKWFLCNKKNFSPGENTWFNNELHISKKNGRRVLPSGHSVELVHWGESEFLNHLSNYPAIHKFFFSEKLFTQQWFRDRYEADLQRSEIKAKYESEIHIPTHIDNAINKLLGGNRLVEILEKEMENQQVNMYNEEYKNTLSKIFSEDVDEEYRDIQIEFRKILIDKENIITDGINRLLDIKKIIQIRDEMGLKDRVKEFNIYTDKLRSFLEEYYQLTISSLCEKIQYLNDESEEELAPKSTIEKSWLTYFKNLSKKIFRKKEVKIQYTRLPKKESIEIGKENEKRSNARDILFGPRNSLKEYAISSLEWCSQVFELLDQNELHIGGEAGMGKTHISFNIYQDQIVNQNQSAIFVFAKDFHTKETLDHQLKNYFDVPTSWSFDDFLGALEISAKISKVRLPIIIDGLNESTHWDSIWKNSLDRLIIKLKKYPHLALITTYRTSYEDQLFPDNYFNYKYNKNWRKSREVCQGFKDLTWKAIQIYFKFYRIKLENHSNAIGYFEHPLHLKLFCETKNPNRDKEITVSFQNEDLFEVFDEYIENSNSRITSLLQECDPKYDSDFTEKKLLQIAEYSWINSVRGVPKSKKWFTPQELRVFEGENLLIFRDWNSQTGKEEIQFTYDLLGGYLISKYLIKKYQNSYPFFTFGINNWFSNVTKAALEFVIPEGAVKLLERICASLSYKLGQRDSLLRFVKSGNFRRKLLSNKNEHPLFDDILRTISILLIKEKDIFLFDILKDEKAKKYSTESLFEINSVYIRKNVKLIQDFLKVEFLKKKTHLFDLAKNIELSIDHPLNFNLWSDFLKSLPMPERDLYWSEYVRRNNSWYGKAYFSDFAENLEEACKVEKAFSDRIHLAAKKTMWILTTNIRGLRDKATRAMYYYARKYPKEFLDLLSLSLDIDDPYISERMLAACYGLAMARQNDLKDKVYAKNYLPRYGKFLFDNFFSKEAKYTTTHILARDYAKRTIDIALLHCPDLLTNSEKELIKYPLKEYLHKNWGESPNRDTGNYLDGNAPIHMDFENYTIGRLVNDRRNYDSHHIEYKKVLSQIYWRIYDLGYGLEKFGEIDKDIAKDAWRHSRDENEHKVDRYGKKYSWIAFYEIAGIRSDSGLLKDWNDEDEFRISDVDIDPSFPTELKQYNLFNDIKNNNFLGDETLTPESWYNTDSDLEIQDYIEQNNNFSSKDKGDWVLLNANISQKNNEEHTRDVHISVNAVLLDHDNHIKVEKMLSTYNDYTFEYLRNPEDHYLFEGEIPWCDLMLKEYPQKFNITYNYRDVQKTKKELTILNNKKSLTDAELQLFKQKEKEYLGEPGRELLEKDFKLYISSFLKIKKNNNDSITKRVAKEMGYSSEYLDVAYVEKENDSMDILIENTIFKNSWEGYHSEIIPSAETQTPSKEICNNLELLLEPQTSDLYNKAGELISTTFKFGTGYNSSSVFTYIKKSYLEEYLKDKKKKIIWLKWSEKRYFPGGIQKSVSSEEREYRTFCEIIL